MYTAVSTAIHHYLSGVYPAGEPGAAVLVMHHGRVLFRAAYGVADIGSGRALNPDDVFHIASITKTFTAAAILQLVDRGVLMLDDQVIDHLPEVPATWEQMTIRHLLTHTSGVVEFTELLPNHADYVHHDTLFAEVRTRPLVSRPGTAWAYSNTGYLLLGLILERHTGQPWGEYMERELYRPLGMSRTVYAGHPYPRLIPGHYHNGAEIVRASTPSAVPYAAGATFSCVDDLARWVTALEQGELLSAAARTESVQRVRLNDDTTGSSGMGWLLSPFGPHEVHWHGGDIVGYASMLLRIPTERLLVIVLSNTEAAPVRPFFVALRLAELTLGEDWSSGVTITAEELEPLTGAYATEHGDRYVVEIKDGQVMMRDGVDGEQELLPLSTTEFVGKMGMRIHFFLESTRLASAMLLRPVFGKEEIARRIEASLKSDTQIPPRRVN